MKREELKGLRGTQAGRQVARESLRLTTESGTMSQPAERTQMKRPVRRADRAGGVSCTATETVNRVRGRTKGLGRFTRHAPSTTNSTCVLRCKSGWEPR